MECVLFAQAVLKEEQRRIPGSSSLTISVALFYFSFINNKWKVEEVLRDAKQCVGTVIQTLLIYAVLRDLERRQLKGEA